MKIRRSRIQRRKMNEHLDELVRDTDQWEETILPEVLLDAWDII
jgi:hypothetical protein